MGAGLKWLNKTGQDSFCLHCKNVLRTFGWPLVSRNEYAPFHYVHADNRDQNVDRAGHGQVDIFAAEKVRNSERYHVVPNTGSKPRREKKRWREYVVVVVVQQKLYFFLEILEKLFSGQVEAMVGCLSQVSVNRLSYCEWI